MGKWVHRLTNIDRENKRADCANCGQGIRIKVQSNGRTACRAPVGLNPTRAAEKRRYQLRNKYDLTAAEYADMWTIQGGLCKICKSPPMPGRLLVIDHCHVTGDVRGLLCHRCNIGLGFFDDDVDRFMSAAEYLKENQPLA
ncbi:MAG TPA: endonuclease VII domain-containing protein [Arthrobacter sp.]|nr:endonuclease VII domain-containing protein [Arthrobacter sp.]